MGNLGGEGTQSQHDSSLFSSWELETIPSFNKKKYPQLPYK
jgi:hypothetical protein